jgi:predicted transcriptional regulator
MKLVKNLQEYKIEIIKMYFDDPSNATSGEVWKYLNAQMGKAAPSRASVIIFLNALVKGGYLKMMKETAKGGYRGVYFLDMSKDEFINLIYKNTQAQLDEVIGDLT